MTPAEILAKNYKLVYLVTVSNGVLLYHVAPAYPPLEISGFNLPQDVSFPIEIRVLLTSASDDFITSAHDTVAPYPDMVKSAINIIGCRLIRQNLSTLLPGFDVVVQESETSKAG